MAEQLFEEAEYTITARLRTGVFSKKDYKGKVDLVYIKNDNAGSPIHTDADLDVSNGQLTKTYTLPKVGDDEATYDLKIVAKWGQNKATHTTVAKATVWPKTVKVHAVTLKDSDFPGFDFEVRQKGEPAESCTTGQDGRCVGPLKAKKPFSIVAKAPYGIVEQKATKPRDIEVKAGRNFKAKIVKPDVSAAPYEPSTEGGDRAAGVRQFVNLTTATDGQDALGSEVVIEVSADPADQGKKGDIIHYEVTFSRESKRNNPVPGIADDPPVFDKKDENQGKKHTGRVVLDADAGTAKFKVKLGLAGGDTCTVKIGGSKDDVTDATVKFVNWRRIGYQLAFPPIMQADLTERTRADSTNFHDLPDAIWNPMRTRMAEGFVSYENIKSKVLADPAFDTPTRIKESFIKDGGSATKDLYVVDGGKKWVDPSAVMDAPATNLEMPILLAHKLVDPESTDRKGWYMDAAEQTFTIDPDKSWLLYLPFSPKHANRRNVRLNGLSWQTDMDNVAADDKSKKPTLEFVSEASPDTTGAAPLVFGVQEVNQAMPVTTVTFTDTTLPPTEKAKIRTCVTNAFHDGVKLRQAGLKIKFKITGQTGNPGDTERFQAVLAAIREAYNAIPTKVLFHPGFDDHANPLTGPMSDIAVELVDARKVKFKLPTRASNADPLKPGDVVGPNSSTKCRIIVWVSLDSAAEFNGQVWTGYQWLALRTAAAGSCASTVCHELGHAMGMSIMHASGDVTVKSPTPPGLEEPKHVDNGGTYYIQHATDYTNGQRNRHQGPHCCDGMPRGKRGRKPTFDDWGADAGASVCIMWGEGGDEDVRQHYCQTCLKYLKARQLTDIRSAWMGRASG